MRTLWNILNDLETSLDNDGITPRTWYYLEEARNTYLEDIQNKPRDRQVREDTRTEHTEQEHPIKEIRLHTNRIP